jgi:hypothetical protein
MFTPFHKLPYTYPYGRSVDETTTSDNLACFKNGFGNSGSFLDVGSHHFYIAKPFPEEVTDVFDPLSDGGLSCSESSDLGAMVEVMALGEEEGGDSPRSARPPLERLPPQEKNAPLLEQDALDIAVVDLRAPLDHIIDPVQVAEALERTRLILLGKVVEDEIDRRRASTTLIEFYACMETHRSSLLMTRGAALSPWALARSSGRYRQAKAAEGADRAVVLQAATPEAAVPSRPAELEGHAKSRRRCQGWSLKLASWPYSSICGLTT